MTSNTELIEPDYWMKSHGRALRTMSRTLGLGRRNVTLERLSRTLAHMAWNYPGNDHRQLINIYQGKYGK